MLEPGRQTPTPSRVPPLRPCGALVIIGLLGATGTTSAQDAPTEAAGTLYAVFDNDLFLGSDDDYTNGGLIGWITPPAPDWDQTPGLGWSAPAFEWIPGMQRDDRWRSISLEAAQLMYTPEDLERDPPDPQDRPYAGVSFLTFAGHQHDRDHLDSVELSLGISGPASLTEETQKVVHEATDSVQAEGWEHQIGQEVVVNLGYEHRWRVVEAGDIHRGFGTDLILGGIAMLGNLHTAAQVDCSLRVGYRARGHFGETSANPVNGGRLIPGMADGPWGCYLSVGVTAEAVGYDLSLDGRLFADDGIAIDREPLVARATIGLGGHIGRLRFSTQFVSSTPTFEQQEDEPGYGRMVLGWTF